MSILRPWGNTSNRKHIYIYILGFWNRDVAKTLLPNSALAPAVFVASRSRSSSTTGRCLAVRRLKKACKLKHSYSRCPSHTAASRSIFFWQNTEGSSRNNSRKTGPGPIYWWKPPLNSAVLKRILPWIQSHSTRATTRTSPMAGPLGTQWCAEGSSTRSDFRGSEHEPPLLAPPRAPVFVYRCENPSLAVPAFRGDPSPGTSPGASTPKPAFCQRSILVGGGLDGPCARQAVLSEPQKARGCSAPPTLLKVVLDHGPQNGQATVSCQQWSQILIHTILKQKMPKQFHQSQDFPSTAVTIAVGLVLLFWHEHFFWTKTGEETS